MNAYCRDCGKKLAGKNARRCLGCHHKRIGQSRVVEPTDDDHTRIMDGLIRQRARALRPSLVCLTDSPQEELAIRSRLGV